MLITVLNNQSLQDISIRYFGTLEALFDIAVLNNIGITQELAAGQILELPIRDYGSQEVTNYFIANQKEPATGIQSNKSILPELGIGKMIIGSTFKVK